MTPSDMRFTQMNKVILYIATSKDGFIADKNGGVDWLPASSDAADAQDEFGYMAILKRINTIVMGSNSYEQILTFGDWAWDDKVSYVFTKRVLITNNPNIKFVNYGVIELISKLKRDLINQDIWLLGGADLIAQFAKNKLIDECIITEVPTKLGEGIRLELTYEEFKLLETKECSNNILQKFYMKKTEVNY